MRVGMTFGFTFYAAIRNILYKDVTSNGYCNIRKHERIREVYKCTGLTLCVETVIRSKVRHEVVR